jgi:sucrose phosphorylase
MKNFGGMISTKSNPDGSESPYEINISYFDALKGTKKGEDNLQTGRFICSQTIMMALKGIPAFYIHSLLATPNNHEGVKRSGKARTINRKKLDYNELERLVKYPGKNSAVFNELRRIIKIRKKKKAFHPDSIQKILNTDFKFLCIYRNYKVNAEELWSLSNITDTDQVLPVRKILKNDSEYFDILEDTKYPKNLTSIKLKPYQTVWLIYK